MSIAFSRRIVRFVGYAGVVAGLSACASNPGIEDTDLGSDAATDAGFDANPPVDAASDSESPIDASPGADAVVPDAGGCAEGQLSCGGSCATCPTIGVLAASCMDSLCVATECRSGYELGGGACTLISGLAQRAYVKASNTGSFDAFGYAIAMSADGSTVAVSAVHEDSSASGIGGDQSSDAAADSGAVYVFARVGATWAQQAYVKASNPNNDDEFGASVALSSNGNTLVVGARGERSAATGVGGNQSDNSADASGALYVFERTGVAWMQQAYIKASNTGAGDWFGSAVAIAADGNTVVVGAPREDSNGTALDNSAMDSGAAYAFIRTGVTWTQSAYVKASNVGAGDFFGNAVALSSDGNTLAIAAVNEASHATGIGGDQSDNDFAFSGAVYVYTRSGSSWIQQAYVKASNTDANDAFGRALALSGDGNTLAVGAPGESSNAVTIGGSQSDNSATVSGAAYVFTRAASTWSQQAYIKPFNTDAFDMFGQVLAISTDGNTLAIGAAEECAAGVGFDADAEDDSAPQAGAIYTMGRIGSSWSQRHYVKASNTDQHDHFGEALSLSGSGAAFAVAATQEQSNATGIDGPQSDNSVESAGAVYLFSP